MSILPNTKEKAFMKAVMDFHNEYGVGYLYGDEWDKSPLQCHHVCGRTYKQNKVHIGHYFILPIPFEIHDVHSNHPLNVTHWRHRFTDKFGYQRHLWRKMMFKMIKEGCDIELTSDDVYSAIMASKF